ncbi:MAG: response regulator, partial [Alicycliphilus sp.]|nr:response regulator [Alicycliphilus sp.]
MACSAAVGWAGRAAQRPDSSLSLWERAGVRAGSVSRTADIPIIPHVTKPRILVVEDEPGIADTIHYALASDGFEPRVCGTAREALEHFTAALPALAILDVGLPDMNGFELFRRLQDLPGGRQVPMLFLTARSAEIDRVVGLELGADDYVAKPFSPRELV